MIKLSSKGFNTHFAILFLFCIACILFSSLLLDRLCVLYITILCVLLGKEEGNLINPYYLFILTPLSLLIYFNVGDFYMSDLSHKTWLIGILNMSAFIWAVHKTPSFRHINNCIGVPSLQSQKRHAIFMLLIGQSASFIPPIASILWIFNIAGMVVAFKTKEKKLLAIVLALFLLNAVSGMASKTEMLMYSMTFLICYSKYYVASQKQIRRLKIMAGVGVVFMIFAFTFANKGRDDGAPGESLSGYESQGVEWNYSMALFMPYMYITNGWTNLQYVMETQDTRTNGLWTARPLLGYVQLKSNFESEYQLQSKSSFNTFCFMTLGFKDFGFWLSILPTLLLGFYCKKIYSRFLISKSPFDIATYILVAMATLELFFSNHFFMQSYPFTVYILMELYKSIICRKGSLELEDNIIR